MTLMDIYKKERIIILVVFANLFYFFLKFMRKKREAGEGRAVYSRNVYVT